MGVLPIGGWGGGGGASLPAGTSGYIMRYIGGSWVARELSASGLAAARPAAAAGREGQFYWSTDAAAGLELAECIHKGGATYAWEVVPYGATATGIALVQAANPAAALAVLGITTPSHTSGTLAARPASPAAGDTYEIISGAGIGDRYQCFVATEWALVDYERDWSATAPYLEWLLEETSGDFAQSGSATGGDLAVTGTPVRSATGFFGSTTTLWTAVSGQYAEGAAALTPTASAFTVSAWVRPATVAWAQTIVVKQYAAAGWVNPYASAYLYLQAGGRPRCGVAIAGALSDLPPGTGEAAVVGQWHHILMTWDGAGSPKRCLYFDGYLYASDSPAGTNVDFNALGPWQVSNGRTEGFLGSVESVRVWDSALTAAQVREIYQRGKSRYLGQ